jgi:anti-sigma regulatory factor (Ser/Thr protein kinase)
MDGQASRVFAGTIGDLRRMSEWFRGLAVAAGLDSETAWQAEVCLNEAGSNIILYGHDDGVPHPITIEIEPLEHGVRMTITDDGRPFNPAEPRELPVVRTIEDMAVGGLGLHMIRAFASEVHYRRDANGNVLVLTFAARRNPEVIGRPLSEAARARQ